jgi:peptide/nickel transport system ATP-binding protein
MSAVLLDVRNLRVHFALHGSFAGRMLGREAGSVKAVDGVSFQVRQGEILGLVGESGSGKTTLGRAILGLAPATSGSILVDGRDISGLSESRLRQVRRKVQMVYQDPHASLNPSMTILQSVGHPLRIHGLADSRQEVRQMVSTALERVGLVPVERFLTKYPGDLSGGQKQRAVLARAVILGPELIVADEPVSMLDMSVRAKVLDLMLTLRRNLGLTYLYITHDLATAKLFCDRIAIMYLGRIVEIGPTSEIFAAPRHPYTAALLRTIPEPDPGRAAPRELPRGEVPDAVIPPLGCGFHPRCSRAFAPCGWEGRDLRALLEQRWTTLSPDDYQHEAGLVHSLEALDVPADIAHVPAPPGRAGELLSLLRRIREEQPDEPLWSGVADMAADRSGVTVRFHPGVDPVLASAGGPDANNGTASVACHLHNPPQSLSASGGATSVSP